MTGIAVSLTADVSDLTAKLAVARANLSAYTADLRKTAAAVRDAGSSATPELRAALAQQAEVTANASAKVNALNGQLKAVTAPMKEVSAAAEHQAGIVREKLIMAHEALMGNYKRLGGSLLVLSERTGGLAGAFRTLLSPAMLVGAAIVGVIAVIGDIIVGIERWHEALGSIKAAMDATGRAVDFNRDQIAGYISKLRELPGVSTAAATEMVTSFARQRDIGVDTFEKLGVAATGYARATGESVPNAAKKLVQALNGGYDALTKLDREFPFLSIEQAKAIHDFDASGNKAAEMGVAIDALTAKFGPLIHDGLTPTQEEINRVGVAWDNLMHRLDGGMHKGAAAAMQSRIALLNSELKHDQGLLKTASAFGARIVQQRIAALQDELRQIQAAVPYVTGAASAPSPAQAAQARADAERLRVLRTIQDENEKSKADDAERARIKAEMARDETALKTATGGEAAMIRDNIALLERQQRTLDNRVGAGQLQGLRDTLDKELVVRRMSGDQQKQYELKFWQDHLAQVQEGSRAEIEIRKQIDTLRNELDTKAAADNKRSLSQEWQDFSQAMRDKIAAASANVGQQVALSEQWVAKGKALYGQDVKNYRDALNEESRLLKQQKADADRIREIGLASKAELAKISLSAAPAPKGGGNLLDMLFGGLSGDQAKAQLDQRLEALKLEFQAKQAEFQDIANSPDSSPVQAAQAMAQLKAATAQYSVETVTLNRQAAQQTRQAWQTAFQPITQAFDTSIKGMIMGTQTFQRAIANLGSAILGEFVNLGVKLVVNWVATEAAKTTATIAGTAARTTAETGASLGGLAMHAATSKVSVMQNAYSAAAAVYNDVAQIPMVGWVLAPAAAAAAFAGVAAYSAMIPSAAGGYDIPAGVNPITQLHEEEMVLPSPLANAVRAMAAGGGGGGGTTAIAPTFNIQALDASSVRSLLLNSQGAISQAIAQAVRTGNSSLSQALRTRTAG